MQLKNTMNERKNIAKLTPLFEGGRLYGGAGADTLSSREAWKEAA
jgi:hypothetical protein